jgi:hypothetical protein
MFVDRKPFIYVWRPFYRIVFAGLIWPFLTRIKLFVIAEPASRLATIEHRLATIEAQNNMLVARIAGMEDEQRKHWDSISKLLLCLFQQPHPPTPAQDVSRRDNGAVPRSPSC